MTERIIDNGDLRKYRTEIPNLIDDMDLSVYAFRLYVHLKRVAGDSGKCWQGKRTLADACKMSAGMVTKAKRELVDAGLIEVEAGDALAGQPDTITICDVWGQNFVRYSAANPGHAMTSPGHTVNGGGHVVNGGGHTVNAKKEPYKKEPYKKEPKESGESISTRQLAPEPVQPKPAPAPKKRGRVTSSDIDPRKLVGGMIPAGEGTTPIEVHREFFDWSIPSEGLSRFNCQVITDEVKDLAKWREVCRAWAEKGYRGGNREGLQEWYRNQHTRKGGGNAKSRSEKPVEGWHPGLIKKWEPEKQYTDEEIDRWLDTLEDRTEQPVVRTLRQRPHQSAAD